MGASCAIVVTTVVLAAGVEGVHINFNHSLHALPVSFLVVAHIHSKLVNIFSKNVKHILNDSSLLLVALGHYMNYV